MIDNNTKDVIEMAMYFVFIIAVFWILFGNDDD